MSLDNIVATVQNLSEETNKLSEEEEANLYVYLTDKDTKLADVEKLLNLCKTDNAKLVYLKGLSKKSVSEQPVAGLVSHQPLELSKKRKFPEDLTKTWKANGTLRETDWPSYYFLDPLDQEQEEQLSLFKKIKQRSFIVLYGTRASGKSTRVMRTISALEKDYICNYLSFEKITVHNKGFWNSLGLTLTIDKRSNKYLESCKNIKSGEEFLRYFSIAGWTKAENDPNDRIILFFDEFDMLYKLDEKVRSEFLAILRSIRDVIESYVIQAIVVIGTFSILHIDATDSNTSPFNIKDSIQNPNFTLNQVQMLFKEFGGDNRIEFEQEVIEDIFTQTNGHAGLVSVCGCAIQDNLIRTLYHNERIISYKIWERYKVNSLMDAMVLYQTFRHMIQSLQDSKVRNAMTFFRNYFLADFGREIKVIADIDSAEYLAAEGVLVPGDEPGTFKLSSPLVRWLILQRVIPIIFPFHPRKDIPYFKNSNDLDIFRALEYVVPSFDKDFISNACMRSYKTAQVRVNGNPNQHVPRECVYDTELLRILRNWLNPVNMQVTGQWHLITYKSNRRVHRYSNIVIDTPSGQKIVLELIATAINADLDEHFDRALEYARLLNAEETWIIHFTCEDEYIKKHRWPSDNLLKNYKLNVAHFYHDTSFSIIDLIACWWDTRKKSKHIYQARF